MYHCYFPHSSVGKESWFNYWVGKIHYRRERLPTPVFLGFPCGSAGTESAYNAGDLGLIPGLRRSPGEGKGYPLQYSSLENPMDCLIHGVTKSWTRLSIQPCITITCHLKDLLFLRFMPFTYAVFHNYFSTFPMRIPC